MPGWLVAHRCTPPFEKLVAHCRERAAASTLPVSSVVHSMFISRATSLIESAREPSYFLHDARALTFPVHMLLLLLLVLPQGANAASVPKPTGSGVFITNTPAMEVYVIQYSGFSSAAMERMKATELIKKLEASKEPFSAGVWYTAGYDSPYTLTNRHNEVWIPRSASGSGAAAGSSGSQAGGAAKTTTESGKKAQDEKKP